MTKSNEKIKYAIEEVAIDTQNINYQPGAYFLDHDLDPVSYLMTTITANNDYLLEDMFKFRGGALNKGLITAVNTTKNLYYLLEEHLRVLGVDNVKILLLPASLFPASEELKKDLADLQKSGIVEEFGLIGVTDTTMLVDKNLIKYVALPLSPLTYNHKVVSWARQNNLSVIGYDIFGDELSIARNVKSFTIPYLLKFAATNANIVVVSGKDMVQANEAAEFLNNLVGEDSSNMYVLKRTTNNKVKPIPKFTYTSVQISDGIRVPYDDPEVTDDIPGTVTTFGDYDKELTAKPKDEITEMLNTLDFSGYSQEEGLAFARYKVLNWLQGKYNRDDEYEYTMAKIGNSVFSIRIHRPHKIKGMLWWLKVREEENYTYLITGTPEDGFMVLKG